MSAARGLLVVLLLAGAISCRAPRSGEGVPEPSAAPPAPLAHAEASIAASSTSTPPDRDRACSRDEDCAVACIETAGPRVCCPACAMTPGTRRWFAELQSYCAAHDAVGCPPLACPQGPTVPVCRAGLCAATVTGADGGPI